MVAVADNPLYTAATVPLFDSCNGRLQDEVCRLMSKVDEMAGVMQHAIRVDNDNANRTHERLSCLELENRTLRELLEISSDSAPTEANLDDTVIHKVPAAGTSSRGQDT